MRNVLCLLLLCVYLVDLKKYLVETESKKKTVIGFDYNNKDDHVEKQCSTGMDYSEGQTDPIKDHEPFKQMSFSKKSCQIHYQCKKGEVCASSGICQTISCEREQNCNEKVLHPVSCERSSGGSKFCNRDKNCDSDQDCKKAGDSYRCQPGTYQCKPTYGTCEDICDCLDKYKMARGEAICTDTIGGSSKVCMCRSNKVAECQSVARDISLTTVPQLNTDPAFDRGEANMPECPEPLSKSPGVDGDACMAHTACFQLLHFMCVKLESQDMGKCKKVSCTSDAECTSQTSLPTLCVGGLCSSKYCYENSDCPTGYGCANGGQCKQNLGPCTFDCDCSACDETECFHETCFCKADHDTCFVSGRLMLRNESSSFHEIVKREVETTGPDKCEILKCPTGWFNSHSGCYKLFKSKKMTNSHAVRHCNDQGGYLAEITTKKENGDLDSFLKDSNSLPVWIGAHRVAGKMVWSSSKEFDYVSEGYRSKKGGNCLVRDSSRWVNEDCYLARGVLCEIGALELI